MLFTFRWSLLVFGAITAPILADDLDLSQSSDPVIGKPTDPVHVKAELVVQRLPMQAVVDLGEIPLGREAHVSLNLRNETAQNLKVFDIGKDCGCISVGDSQIAVANGSQADLAFQLAASSKAGSIGRRISIAFNGYEQSPVVVGLRATYVGVIRVRRQEVNFDTASPIATLPFSVRAGCELVGVETCHGILTTAGIRKVGAHDYELDVETSSETGGINELLRFKVQCSNDHQVEEIPIAVNKAWGIRTLPRQLELEKVGDLRVGMVRIVEQNPGTLVEAGLSVELHGADGKLIDQDQVECRIERVSSRLLQLMVSVPARETCTLMNIVASENNHKYSIPVAMDSALQSLGGISDEDDQ